MNNSRDRQQQPDGLSSSLDRLGGLAPEDKTEENPAYRRWRKDVQTQLYLRYAAPYVEKDPIKYEARINAILEFVDKDLPRFSPEKAKLSHYFNFICSRTIKRHNGSVVQENTTEQLFYTDEEGVEYDNPKIPYDKRELENSYEKIEREKIQRRKNVIEAMAKILCFSEDRKNSTRPFFFPMWFSEMTTHYIKDGGETVSNNEREIFEAMSTRYLDFFMEKECRSLLCISGTPLRFAAEIDPKAKPGERLAFDNGSSRRKTTGKTNEAPSGYFLKPLVPMEYLRNNEEYQDRIAPDVISKSRKGYLEFLQNNLKLPE